MNAKKAKQLRRQAEQESVGMPARRTLSLKAHISSPRTKSRIALMRAPTHDKEGKRTGGWGLPRYTPVNIINDPESTRGIYRSLKSRA